MGHLPTCLGITAGAKIVRTEEVRERQGVRIEKEERGRNEQGHAPLTKGHGEVSRIFQPCVPGVPHLPKGVIWKRSLYLILLTRRVSP